MLRLGQTIRGPSAAARTDEGAGRCGHMTQLYLTVKFDMHVAIDRRGAAWGRGVLKSSLGNYPVYSVLTSTLLQTCSLNF